MNIFNLENRLMVLHCIRENALNMRQVCLNSSNYNGTLLERARYSLDCIEQLNVLVNDMKSVVDQFMITMEENPGEIDRNELNVILEIFEILINAVDDESANQIDVELDMVLKGVDSFQNDNEDMKN